MSEAELVATITGTDDWLRSHLIRRMSTAGISAKDGGRGSSVLNGTDVLVVLPALFPLSASPSRDAGVAAAGISLGAVVAFNVSRVVVLSRVGASSGGGRYLSELAAVERMASAASPRTTIVRVTHPFGEVDDPGTLASTLMNDQQPWQGNDPSVQPVSASNVVDVLEAAVDGRIKPGLVEVGGPVSMPMSSLSAHLPEQLFGGTRVRRPHRTARTVVAAPMASVGRRAAGPGIRGQPQVRPTDPDAAPRSDGRVAGEGAVTEPRYLHREGRMDTLGRAGPTAGRGEDPHA